MLTNYTIACYLADSYHDLLWLIQNQYLVPRRVLVNALFISVLPSKFDSSRYSLLDFFGVFLPEEGIVCFAVLSYHSL